MHGGRRRPQVGTGRGADEAAPDGALPARAALQTRTALASSRSSARRRWRSPRHTSSGARWRRREEGSDTHLLGWFVAAFVAVRASGSSFTYAETYFTGWTGERMPRRPAQPALPPPAAALARVLRAAPRRGDHQPPDERRRGARPARDRRHHVARAELADARRHGRHPLLPDWRLALATLVVCR